MPQLTETEINIRKQTLEGDLQTVKDSLNKLDTERTNLVAQHHAISGAIQQCDLFLSELKVVPEDTGSSIPKKKG
jgi:chaperonin cofactor prefoldin